MTKAELKQQLTAAEEQLAEMRKVLEDIEWIDDTSYGLGCPLCGQAHNKGHDDDCAVAKALSAAPKRGRVLWEREGKATTNHSKLNDWAWLDVFFVGVSGNLHIQTSWAELPDIVKRPVTVTVREAE